MGSLRFAERAVATRATFHPALITVFGDRSRRTACSLWLACGVRAAGVVEGASGDERLRERTGAPSFRANVKNRGGGENEGDAHDVTGIMATCAKKRAGMVRPLLRNPAADRVACVTSMPTVRSLPRGGFHPADLCHARIRCLLGKHVAGKCTCFPFRPGRLSHAFCETGRRRVSRSSAACYDETRTACSRQRPVSDFFASHCFVARNATVSRTTSDTCGFKSRCVAYEHRSY